MGSREIQSVFSSIRNVARNNCPEKVSLINKLERISLSHYNGKLSAEKTRVAVRQVLLNANENPSMLDMAEAQARSSKMLGIIPEHIPSSKGSVVGLLNQKQVKRKVSNYNGGIFSGVNLKQNNGLVFKTKQVKQIKNKGLVFNPSIVGGKVNNNHSIFNQYSNRKQVQSKGIFSGVNLKQNASYGKGIFGNIESKSKPIKLNILGNSGKGMSFASINMGNQMKGIFGKIKKGKQKQGKGILELMNEGK